MANKNNGLVLGIVAGAALYMITRQKDEPDEPMGDGLQIPTGPAAVSGTLGVVSVAQAISKEYGSLIRVDGVWNGTTALASKPGVPIPWAYRITARLGHSVLGAWKTSNQLGFSLGVGVTEYPSISGPQSFVKFFTTPSDPNQTWDIHVMLEAQADDNKDGLPDGPASWKLLWEDKHDGAIVSIPPPLPGAVASGTLGIASVSQRRLVGRMGL